MCHTGDIPCNKSDQWVLKNSQGPPYKTSCTIFCNSSKHIDVYKSPKNIEFYTIQAIMCHTGDIPCNKSERWVLKKYQGRPATYFLTVLNRLTRTNLPKTLKYIQYRLLHVTQVTYWSYVRISPAYSLHRRSCVIPKIPIMRGKLSIMTYDDMAVIPAMKISLRYLQDVI